MSLIAKLCIEGFLSQPFERSSGVLHVTGHSDLEIKRRKFGWLCHTLRKGYDENPSTALTWNTQGNRKRGRPKISWLRAVEKEYSKGTLWEGMHKLESGGRLLPMTYVPSTDRDIHT
jgi:hypothetical protein